MFLCLEEIFPNFAKIILVVAFKTVVFRFFQFYILWNVWVFLVKTGFSGEVQSEEGGAIVKKIISFDLRVYNTKLLTLKAA